jgi:hypothetical protein
VMRPLLIEAHEVAKVPGVHGGQPIERTHVPPTAPAIRPR